MRRVAKPVVGFPISLVTDKTLLLSESGKQNSPKKSRVRGQTHYFRLLWSAKLDS
jgi:hypothetical protein